MSSSTRLSRPSSASPSFPAVAFLLLCGALALLLGSCASIPAPSYAEAEPYFPDQGQEAADFDGLLAATGAESFKDLKVEVEYTANTLSTFDYLAKWKKSYLDNKSLVASYAASAVEVDPELLADDLVAELGEQFGAVLLPGERGVETQLKVLVDVKARMGAASGAITTVDIDEYYIDEGSGRLLFRTRDRGEGSVPYPAYTLGFGDAKKMALSHIYKRCAGLAWDEEAEYAAAENRAAQSRSEAATEISSGIADVAQAASNLAAAEEGAQAGSSQEASEAPVLSASGRYSREFYQNQYDKQKKMALSMLGSYYHRTIYENQLYGGTGGRLGSRPNATLDVSLLQSYRSSQNRLRGIRSAAKRDGYDIEPSPIETYNP